MESDSELLLDKFPSEIWMKVFNKFEEKKCYADIENSINSSNFFRNLLQNTKTTILFPKVFQVLLPKYEKSYEEEYHEDGREITRNENNSDSSESDDDEFPHSRPRRKQTKRQILGSNLYSSRQTPILKMREICKNWCHTIDHHYQNLDYHFKMEHDHHPVAKGIEDYSDSEDDGDGSTDEWDEVEVEKVDGEEWSNEQFNCWEYKDALQFIKHYKNTHPLEGIPKNPFIGRSISIGEGSPGSFFHEFHNARANRKDTTFWNAITSILENYGEYIWFCELNIRDKFPSRVEYYRQIKQWLALMPNLKCLDFSYQLRMPDNQYPTTVELNLLRFEIDGNPLPEMGNLMFLKTRRVPSPIFNELLKKTCGKLEMLEIGKNKCQIGHDIYSVEMSNLKQLSIQVGSIEEIRRMDDVGVKWNLKKLYLDIDKEMDFINWSTIFKLIKNKWSDTLTNLMINLPKAKKKAERTELLKDLSTDKFELNLPNVKRFKLIISNQTPIDFILPMKDNLEVFEIGFLYKCATRRKDGEEQTRNNNQLIKLVGYEGRFYESNIWELFPKLERIQVWYENGGQICWKSVDNLYTREKWEVKNKKMVNS